MNAVILSNPLLASIVVAGILGSLLFSVFLILMARSGIAAEIRDEEGHFKKLKGIRAWFGMLFFIAFLLSVLIGGNLLYAHWINSNLTLFNRFLNAFGVFLFLHVYDLLIIDYLIVVKWHPAFLNLPETGYYSTMKPHIVGFIRGLPLGIVFSVIAATISYFF